MRRQNAPTLASRRDPPAEMASPPRCPSRYHNRCFLCSFNGLFASIFAIVAVLGLLYYHVLSYSEKFAIIIDGGSTGTRMHVFVYRNGWEGMPAIDFGLTASMKVVPGLSAFADDPEKAVESLMELLEFGKDRVPKDRWMATEIRLMATAGLRLLNGDLAEAILEFCRKALRESGFNFRDDWASVISGADEGIYAWVAANYALGSLGKDAEETYGIVELGGASAQMTFVSNEQSPSEFLHVLKFEQVIYNLYSHSFLYLGQNVAYENLHQLLSLRHLKTSPESVHQPVYRDPCAPKGYGRGVEQRKLSSEAFNSKIECNGTPNAFGNFSECRSAALMILQKEKDDSPEKLCYFGSSYIPKLPGRVIATENFFHTSKFFGLGPSSLLSDLALAGKRFCEEDWLNLKDKYRMLEEEDLLRYCFSSAYIVALLHDCLGIAMNDSRVLFSNQVGEVPLDWALGAFIMQKKSDGAAGLPWIFVVVRALPLPMLYGFLVISILAFPVLSLLKRWKPQFRLKTIYDMENGRYVKACIRR